MVNSKLAAQYTPGDIIQYRQGSPRGQGIPRDTVAVVVFANTKNNQLAIGDTLGVRLDKGQSVQLSQD